MKTNLWSEPGSELLLKCKDGDEEALTELFVALTPMVRYIAKGFTGINCCEMEDFIQEGYISILKAVNGYERARGKFSSYCYSCVRNGMITNLRRNREKFSVIPIAEEMPSNGTFFRISSVDYFPDQMEQDFLNDLTCLEMAVLDVLLETGSISEAAMILKCPRKRVDNAVQRIRKKVSAKIEARDL